MLGSFTDSDIYSFLGLDKEKIVKEVEQYTGKKHSEENTSKGGAQKINKSTVNFIPVDNAASFFDSLKTGSSQAKAQQEK